MTDAIELIRVSTETQAGVDRAGIPAQHSVNLETAARFGLKIVKTFEISGVSGASALLAPEILQLINLISSSEIGAVVTREFSRIIRPEKFSDYILLQAFADSKTLLYLPDGPIDFSEKTGRFMGTIFAAIAGLERSEIRERCWRGKEEKRRAGKHASGNLPFGVGYDKQRGWFYTEDAQLVRQAYDIVLSGETRYREIAERTGLSQNRLHCVLHNPIYKGWRIYDKKCDPARRHVKADGRHGWSFKIPRNQDEIIRVQVITEPLVSAEQWEHVRQVLRREGHSREALRKSCIYRGLVFCVCGAPMYCHFGHESRAFYVCRSRRREKKPEERCPQPFTPAAEIDNRIDEFLNAKFSAKPFVQHIARYFEGSDHSKSVKGGRRELLDTRLRSLDRRKTRAVEAYINGAISRKARAEIFQTIALEVAIITEDLERIKRRSVHLSAPERTAAALELFIGWDLVKREDRRKILESVGAKFYINHRSFVGTNIGIETLN